MKSKFLRVLALAASAVLAVTTMTACGGVKSEQKPGSGSGEFDQLAAPVSGDTIATMKIKGYGEVKIRLFKETTPKAFENFTVHANNGYYNGLKFHRVIENFMIQGGDPEGTGMGGESIWGTGFGTEIDENLHHYAGALAMAQSSLPDSIGSQFYIVTGDKYDKSKLDQMAAQAGVSFDDATKQKYTELGGAPFLDGNYTVFGQVFEGQDIVERISKVKTDGQDMPLNDVIIESIKIEKVA